jgi:hypothetical protein
MGKDSGTCSRQPLEIGSVPITSKTDPLGKLDLKLKRLNFSDKVKWVSTDRQVFFNKNSKGWYATSYNNTFKAAMAKIGLDSPDTIFPSLKEVRGAVADAALYSDLSLSPKLKYPGTSGYKIGDLPLRISRSTYSWEVKKLMYSADLSEEIADYFPEGKGEFWEVLEKTHVLKTNYPTRQSAVSDVKEWLQEYIKDWMVKNTPPTINGG